MIEGSLREFSDLESKEAKDYLIYSLSKIKMIVEFSVFSLADQYSVYFVISTLNLFIFIWE